jgi:hypothetical protein
LVTVSLAAVSLAATRQPRRAVSLHEERRYRPLFASSTAVL